MECIGHDSHVPAKPGVYAWYFDCIPTLVPGENLHKVDGSSLLYLGISPSRRESAATLRRRISMHYCNNASGSTLRKTLGILLERKLGFPLHRVGNGDRMTFTNKGEQALDKWMDAHARVCWMLHPWPWEIEKSLIIPHNIPLNLEHNEANAFHKELERLRASATAHARDMDVFTETEPRRPRRIDINKIAKIGKHK